MDARELALWEAEYRLEPWGDYRDDLRQALDTACTLNAWRGKGSRRVEPKDVLLSFDRRPTRAQTPAEQKAALRGWVAAWEAKERLERR